MITQRLNDLAASAGVSFFDYQLEAFEKAAALPGPSQRVCLYYRTGAGKSLTSLVLVSLWGHDAALVIAPPSTHDSWIRQGQQLGVQVEAISHAKFRMKDYRLAKDRAVIADEMHLFGGHGGKGWKKLDRLAGGLQAPLVLASATPNYNDADRVYCIQHILDPRSVRGGFLEFLYAHCRTKQNPFGQTPLVDDEHPFLHFKDAAEYLAALPNVYYLPDDLVYQIEDIELDATQAPAFDRFGYDARSHRVMASIIEKRHKRVLNTLVSDDRSLRDKPYDILTDLVGAATTPVLIYAMHSTVADALGLSLWRHGVKHAVVTGDTSARAKARYLDAFRAGELDVLVGTATLATGTDGLDKMCDCLIILDDTDDDAHRRQLVGRIMPRGADADATKKQVYRLVLT